MSMPRTLYDKIWDDHVVASQDDGTALLYIDRHLVHEVTSPQAFEGLRATGRKVRSPERTLAVVDHNVQTTDRTKGIEDPESRIQIETLAENVKEFGVEYFDALDRRQGIVHIIGPEQASPCPVRPLFAAIHIPRRMAHSARWRRGSVPRKWSTCLPRRR